MYPSDDFDTRSMASSQQSFLDIDLPGNGQDPVRMFQEAVQAQRDTIAERDRLEGKGLSEAMKQTLTIDLSRRSISELPEEIIDIIKADVER